MAITLTEEELQRLGQNSDDDLVQMVVANERKRRRIDADKKAYAAVCKDMTDMIEAQTIAALDVLEKREIAAGSLKPPGPAPIVAFPVSKVKAPKRTKAKKAA